MIFLIMFGGSMADRFDKRRILVWTQVVQIILALVLGTLIYLGTNPDLADHRGRRIVRDRLCV